MHQLETYRDIVISIDDNGKFVAEVNGKIYRRASLSPLKKIIDDNSAQVDAFVLWSSGPHRVTVVGPYRRNKYRDAFKTSDNRVVGNGYDDYVYRYDQELFDWFVDWNKRKEELEKERREMIKNSEDKRLRRADF